MDIITHVDMPYNARCKGEMITTKEKKLTTGDDIKFYGDDRKSIRTLRKPQIYRNSC